LICRSSWFIKQTSASKFDSSHRQVLPGTWSADSSKQTRNYAGGERETVCVRERETESVYVRVWERESQSGWNSSHASGNLICRFYTQTLIFYKLGFNQNYHTFTLMLLVKTVLCSKFPWTKFINYKCFEVRFIKTDKCCNVRHSPQCPCQIQLFSGALSDTDEGSFLRLIDSCITQL